MADDSKDAPQPSTSAASPSESTLQQVDSRSQILAQATRFLTSANISESASEDDKREFLRSKGLSEDEITKAFEDSQSPAQRLNPQPAQSGDVDPFELTRRQFDDPINADSIAPPPKSYPNSPLALYYDPPSSQSSSQVQNDQRGSVSPLTRYQVLLQFFRTLSLMMMLGGGFTAILVSAYRAYILPKITAMFDARSIVLKHHIVLFDKLRSNVSSMATYVPIQHGRVSAEEGSATAAASPLKGVLKKVHFNDEVAASEAEKEGVKSTQHKNDAKSSTEKVVMPGTDVVVDAKTPLLSDQEKEGSEADSSSAADEEDAEAAAPKLEPIDLMTPIRESMAKLVEVLKGDLSGRSSTTTATATTTPAARSARVASVTDAGSGSDEWEDDDEADGSDDDDGLEFDPYGAYQKKHKHTQSSATAPTQTSRTELTTTLAKLNADISSHAFAATSSSYGHGAFRFGPGTTDANAGGSGAESPKSGDLGQVKAEIRSLKGLLLSRRNFPSYGARPPPLPAATAGSTPIDARASSAVV